MKKVWVVLLIVGIIAVAGYILFMTTYYVTSHPTLFCARCHFLEPYVASWQEEKHAGINCMHCHEMRGFIGKIEAKSRGLNYLYQTLTRQYTVPVEAKIFEQNCLACHLGAYRQYPDTKRINNTGVNHEKLIRENRKCIECHRDTGHGVNLLVKPELFE